MTDEKDQYPKEIATIERITEESEETIKIITIVKNEFEEKAVKVAIAYMDSFNKRDGSGCDKSIFTKHINSRNKTRYPL